MSAKKRYDPMTYWGVWIEFNSGFCAWHGAVSPDSLGLDRICEREKTSPLVLSATIRAVTLPPPDGWEKGEG